MQTMCLCWSPNPNNIIHLFISAQSRRPAGLTCHGYLNGEWNDELSPRQWRPLHREAHGLDLLIALSAGSPQQGPCLLDQLRQRKTQICPHRPGQACSQDLGLRVQAPTERALGAQENNKLVLFVGLFSASAVKVGNQCNKNCLVWVSPIWHWWPLVPDLGLHSPPCYSFIHLPLLDLVMVKVGSQCVTRGSAKGIHTFEIKGVRSPGFCSPCCCICCQR